MVNITTTSTRFQEHQQKTTQAGHVNAIDIELAIKGLDHHIERLEAKMSFLIRSYDYHPLTDLSDQYEKKLATIKEEIDDTVEHRRELARRLVAAAPLLMRNMIVEDENYWQSELSSLGIECKRRNEFNDKEKLKALATLIKEVYFQDYKTAYVDA
jgi:predicted RNase H-like nuclease (RuvC/YqgF family)